MGDTELRDHALAIWNAAVEAVKPRPMVIKVCAPKTDLFERIRQARRIIVVGGGKAGAAMVSGLTAAIGPYCSKAEGIISVPEGFEDESGPIRLKAGRPQGKNQPTAQGVRCTEEMLKLVESANADDLVLCLLSGGGSALLPAPVPGVSLADKLATTQALHRCGATIQEMNCVRKHLSRFKGGGLAQISRAGHLVSLILSDVVGDPLDVIASGPTSTDPTTFADALAVLSRRGIIAEVPGAVRTYLERGADGKEPETLKALPPNVENIIIANNALALAQAQRHAESLGYRVVNLGSQIEGEASEVAGSLAETIIEQTVRPICVLWGGETTVTLPAVHGLGGRNMELSLATGMRIHNAGLGDWAVLSAGTDGEDGPTDAAGGLVTPKTFRLAAELDLDARETLASHDSYTFLQRTDSLIKTGLTDTNVMDIGLALLAKD